MENNPAYYPPVGFYFSVMVDGESMSFKEVSGISQELGVEEVTERDENRFIHRLPTNTKHPNLVLKRGILLADSIIAKWCTDTISGDFSTSISPKTITVNLLDEKVTLLISWTFNNAYPVGYSVSDLHAEKNELMIESMEFAYSGFEHEDKVV